MSRLWLLVILPAVAVRAAPPPAPDPDVPAIAWAAKVRAAVPEISLAPSPTAAWPRPS